ncbi:hypothetical protein VTL71DRAFT_9702 [Oculimacula yallundae]|uniref:NAD(P)-binding domain-containing protein n=1 Tax=Oculimacula yallundae TaxID=86028 RepID=A0ABR4BRL1_9HELO
MKIILSGTTGFIGTEILNQALASAEITSIIVLSRKPLPEKYTSNPKLKVIIIEDFISYSPEVLKELDGAVGCIWAIGAKSLDAATARKVTVDYTLAAVKAFSTLSGSKTQPFRFVFVSGAAVVRDQKANVWLFPTARKVAGEAEINLLAFAEKSDGKFESFITRPAFVLPKETGLQSLVMSLLPSLKVDALAAALLDTVANGGASRTLENADLARRGKELAELK